MLFTTDDISPFIRGGASMSDTAAEEYRHGTPLMTIREALGVIEPNTTKQYVSKAAWALHDLVKYCVHQIGPAEFTGFTWSLTHPAANMLVRLKNDGWLKSARIILDVSMRKMSRDAVIFLRHNDFKTRTTVIHAKGFVLRGAETSVAVISSANFSNNPRIEADILTTCPAAVDFHAKWLSELFEHGEALNDLTASSDGVKLPAAATFDRVLFVVRGLPGAGKSALANLIAEVTCSHDDYFTRGDHYVFSSRDMPMAVANCFNSCRDAMETGVSRIAIDNNFVNPSDIKPYKDLAAKFGYTVFQIIVENNHGNQNVHEVPPNTVNKMRREFITCL